jgi:hypothetical protein
MTTMLVDVEQLREAARKVLEKRREAEQEKERIRKAQETVYGWVSQYNHRAR